MSKPIIHAKSSAIKFGGVAEDYLPIHDLIDSSKAHIADHRHRALFHSSFGCFIVEKMFGATRVNSAGGEYSPRDVAEQHILEDIGHIPTVQDWLQQLPLAEWMGGGKKEDIPSAGGITQYKSLRERLNELHAEAQSNCKAELEAVFSASPFAMVAWQQYTPGFNDGDPCTFRVRDVLTADDEDAEHTGTIGEEDEGWEISTYVHNKEDPEEVASCNARKIVGEAVDGFRDFLEGVFGNDKQILWVRGKGFSIREYDCGY